MNFIDKNGDWFSFISLLISTMTFLVAVFIRRRLKDAEKLHFVKTRIPENIDHLKTNSKRISELLADFQNQKTEIKAELSRCLSYLKSVEFTLQKKESKSIYDIKSDIKSVLKKKNHKTRLFFFPVFIEDWYNGKKLLHEQHIDSIYISLSGLITELDNLVKDKNNRIT